jgi:murein L,D-transpeptidase YcbB/YkuD
MSFLTASSLVKNKNMKIFLKITFLLLLFLGCKKEATNLASTTVSTNLILEKAEITSFFKNYPENETIQNSVLLFYKNRNYNYAWFNQDGMTEAVLNFQNQLQNYSYDFQDKSLTNNELSELIASKNQTETNAKKKETLELLLTTTYFKYARKAFGGITKTAHELDWYIPREKKNYQVLLDSLVLKDENNTSYEPVNSYYSKLKEKLRLYRNIQKKVGFQSLN